MAKSEKNPEDGKIALANYNAPRDYRGKLVLINNKDELVLGGEKSYKFMFFNEGLDYGGFLESESLLIIDESRLVNSLGESWTKGILKKGNKDLVAHSRRNSDIPIKSLSNQYDTLKEFQAKNISK